MTVIRKKKEGITYRAAVDIPEKMHEEVLVRAAENGQTLRGFLLCAVRDYLSKMRMSQASGV